MNCPQRHRAQSKQAAQAPNLSSCAVHSFKTPSLSSHRYRFPLGLPRGPSRLYSPGYSGFWSLLRRTVTAEKAEVRTGRLGPQGQGRVEVQGATLTNGPGRCPDASQEQQGRHSESCYLGSRATWHSRTTCNRHHAGATVGLSLPGWGLGTGPALPSGLT